MQVHPQDTQVTSVGYLQVLVHSHHPTRDIRTCSDAGGASRKLPSVSRYLSMARDCSVPIV
jgi:hypothetical protein